MLVLLNQIKKLNYTLTKNFAIAYGLERYRKKTVRTKSA